MGEKRKALFVDEFNKTPDGKYIVCIAEEGEPGYNQTDWRWGKDKAFAEKLANEYNEKLGLDRKEAMNIILSTLGV